MKLPISLLVLSLFAVPALAQKPDRPFRVTLGILDPLHTDTGFSRKNYTSLGVSYDLKTLSALGTALTAGLFYDSSSGRDSSESSRDAFVWGAGVQARLMLPCTDKSGRPYVGIGVGSFRNSQSSGETTTRTDTVGTRLTLGYELTRGFLAEISYLRLSKNELMQYRLGYRF